MIHDLMYHTMECMKSGRGGKPETTYRMITNAILDQAAAD